MDGSDEAPPTDPPAPALDPPRSWHNRAARLVSGLFAPDVRQGAVGLGGCGATQGAAGQAAGRTTQGAAGQAAVRANEADAEQAKEGEDASTLTIR